MRELGRDQKPHGGEGGAEQGGEQEIGGGEGRRNGEIRWKRRLY